MFYIKITLIKQNIIYFEIIYIHIKKKYCVDQISFLIIFFEIPDTFYCFLKNYYNISRRTLYMLSGFLPSLLHTNPLKFLDKSLENKI